MTLRDSVQRISPPWLADGTAKRILWGTGLVLDAMREKVRQGVKARFPGEGTPQALPYLERDRLIYRGIDEPDATFATRLSGAFGAWQVAGSPHELLRQLRAHFLATTVAAIRVVSDRGVWHAIDMTTGIVTRTIASPSNWTWDAYSFEVATPGTQRHWRGWVVIDMSAGPWAPPPVYGTPGLYYGGGAVYGLSGATENDVLSLQRLVRTWKPKHMHVVNIIATFDASLFNPADAPGYPMPDGTFDDPSNRPTDAAYLEGVS